MRLTLENLPDLSAYIEELYHTVGFDNDSYDSIKQAIEQKKSMLEQESYNRKVLDEIITLTE